jgi:hypothetical protein
MFRGHLKKTSTFSSKKRKKLIILNNFVPDLTGLHGQKIPDPDPAKKVRIRPDPERQPCL